MEAVLIGSQPYVSYATVEQGDAYFAAALHAANWVAASELSKAQALVTATRVLDRQSWGEAYDTQEERSSVEDIQNACLEMALALLDGSDLQSESTTAQKLSSIKAGSVSLTYFRGAEGIARRFPLTVDEYLRPYLAGSAGIGGGKSFGVGGGSVTDDDFGHTGGI